MSRPILQEHCDKNHRRERGAGERERGKKKKTEKKPSLMKALGPKELLGGSRTCTRCPLPVPGAVRCWVPVPTAEHPPGAGTAQPWRMHHRAPTPGQGPGDQGRMGLSRAGCTNPGIFVFAFTST